MYNKNKGSHNPPPPSDAQAREKLIVYVYEYLMHNGAQKAANIFLNEINFGKNINLTDAPGFLQSWWYVFWDLYCAAPERRDTCEHSSEAKAFHDYNYVNQANYSVNGITHPNAASPLGQMPPNDGLSGGNLPPGGFFPHQNSHMRPSPPQQPSQPAPHPQPAPHQQPPPHPQPPPPHGQMIQNQGFMPGRYPGGPRPNVRMSQSVDFNGPPDGGDYVNWQGPPQMNHRMNPPRGPSNYGGMRPPNAAMGPCGMPPGMPPGMPVGGPGPGGPGPGVRPWQPNSYSSSSPGSHYGGPPVSGGPPGPGTPIMPSPQGSAGPYSPASHRMGTPGFPMGPGQGPDGPMSQLDLDGMKNSPANGPGTPRDVCNAVQDGGPMSDYGIYGQENDQNESEAILKIKESMQEEAKKFEKDTPNDHPESFLTY